MSETPIERLNYFNGQRLEADDLRLEQQYHVRIQRLLMKSLFSPGVAEGFEVSPIEAGNKVVVQPGLALDDLGRAIILVNPIELVPQGRYLCVRYMERKEGVQGGECKVKGNGPGTEQQARWGGPGRITSEPDFFWRQAPPLADTRELVIAELRLDPNCKVEKVEGGPRRQAVPAPLARVRPISLEGEKDIDRRNRKVIRFHIAHARPTAVTLYLRASAFSTLHYTEMPRHNHSCSNEKEPVGPVTVPSTLTMEDAASGLDAHKHGVNFKTGKPAGSGDGAHKHNIISSTSFDITGAGAQGQTLDELALVIQHPPLGHLFERTLTTGPLPGKRPAFGSADVNVGGVRMIVSEGDHLHDLSGETDSQTASGSPNKHKHVVNQFDVAHHPKGATGSVPARSGEQLSYFNDLQVKVDNQPCTSMILSQINEPTHPKHSAWIGYATLGGGIPPDSHPLVVHGTGPIRLDLIVGLDFSPDTGHEIEIAVLGEGNGGCIQYNLYVE